MSTSALQVVEALPFYRGEIDVNLSGKQDAHSLHYIVPFSGKVIGDLPAYFIRKYTRESDVVLDPFMDMGVSALETSLLGRIFYGCDSDALSERIVWAKLHPCDISEVTLALQTINLRKPFNLDLYTESFSPFYDPDTFRELVNLQSHLRGQRDRVSRFLEVLALSLLHGHGAGFFSVYTFPQISITPGQQEAMNSKRRQSPDYRAVAPRVIKKAAQALRDGIPSVLQMHRAEHRIRVGQAHDLTFVPDKSVHLIMTTPPVPGGVNAFADLWLRGWFADIARDETIRRSLYTCSVAQWKEYMNEALLEFARVLRPGGRAVLDLRDVSEDRKLYHLEDELSRLVEEHFSRYWMVESILLPKLPKVARNCITERDSTRSLDQSRILVLRRK